ANIKVMTSVVLSTKRDERAPLTVLGSGEACPSLRDVAHRMGDSSSEGARKCAHHCVLSRRVGFGHRLATEKIGLRQTPSNERHKARVVESSGRLLALAKRPLPYDVDLKDRSRFRYSSKLKSVQ